jgi:hypothetical protein
VVDLYLNWTQSGDVRVFGIKILFERFVLDLRVVDRRQRIDVLRLHRRDRVAVGVVLDIEVIFVGS